MSRPEGRPLPLLAQALMMGSGLVLAAWALPLLAHRTAWQGPLTTLAVLVTTAGAAGAGWAQYRARLPRDLAASLQPLLRPETPADIRVRIRRRRLRPTSVRIVYPPQFDDRREENRTAVRATVAARIGHPVTAEWRRTKHTILLRVHTESPSKPLVESDKPATLYELPGQQQVHNRAGDVARAILGQSAEVSISFGKGSVEPDSIEVAYATTARDLSPAFRQRTLLQIDQKLPGQWRDFWNFEKNTVRFTPRPPFPANVPYPVKDTQPYGVLPYAVTEDGSLRTWTLGSKNPHMLVVGPTGSGKTVFVRNMVLGAVMQGIPVILLDPKRTEYLEFGTLPGVTLVTETADICSGIFAAAGMMDERYEQIESLQVPVGGHGKVLVVLDEFAVFRTQANQLWAREKREKNLKGGKEHPCLEKWTQLVLMGRTAEMHAVLGLQRPDAEIVQGMLRDSFRGRIALDQHTRETATMMWSNPRTGTRLPSIQGRGIAATTHGLEEVQVLRVIPPTAGGDETDTAIWETAAARASDPALWAQSPHLPDSLQALRDKRHRALTARAGTNRAAISLYKADPGEGGHQLDEESAAASVPEPAREADEEEPDGVLESTDVYDLDEDETVLIEDETGIPSHATITDITYPDHDEDEPGSIEITYVLENGSHEVRGYAPGDTLPRSTR